MHRGNLHFKDLVGLPVAAVACLAPTAWISFPAAASLVLWMPGRSLLRVLKGVDTAPGPAWAAVGASLVLMPVPLSWVWQISNYRFAILAVVLAINVILMLLGGRADGPAERPAMFPTAATRRVFGGMVIWMAACVFGSFWIPRAVGGAATTAAHDYIKHHAVMLSLERYPLPLHNVFYAAESDTPYYYYEYHYLVPAALRTLTGNSVSIPFAFGFSAATLAAVFMALVFLLARGILDSVWGALLATACVSLVGGFDIIPVLLRVAAGGNMVVTLDAWCPVAWRIHNLATQYFWCPQHISAAAALLLCAYWLRCAPGRGWWVLVGPLLGASVFGSSVYLAMIIFPAAAIYVALEVRRAAAEDRVLARRMVAAVGAIAALGVLLMAYQAWQYSVMSGRYAGGLTVGWPRFPLAVAGRILPPGPWANLLDAPWLLLVDFGLPAIACLLVSRRVWASLWADPGTRLVMIAGGLGMAAFFSIRSDVHSFDYGFRLAIMPAMVVAALCAGALVNGDLLRPFARTWRWPIIALGVLVGLPVGCYEAPVTATRTLLLRHADRGDAGALAYLREHTPLDAVIQADPKERLTLAALVDRQLGVLDPDWPHVAVFRPLDPARMRKAFNDVEEAFSTDSGHTAYAKLRVWGVNYVLAGSVERRRFGVMDQFRDATRFEIIYTDAAATVYRLIEGTN